MELTHERCTNTELIIRENICVVRSQVATKILTERLRLYREIYRYSKKARRKMRQRYPVSLVKNGVFPTGLLEDAVAILKRAGIRPKLSDHRAMLNVRFTPELPGGVLRNYQETLARAATECMGGVIESPMRSGKTIIIAGIIHAFVDTRALCIMPSKSTLFRQTISSLKKFLGTHVGCVGDGEEDWANVTVGMIKSVYNAWRQGRLPRFDLLVIDECHNVSKLDGQYAELLNNLPVRRYGVTATPQKKLELKDLPEPFVVMRSCLGRMVGEITEEELMQDGFIARPRMKFLRVPINHKVKQLNAWTDVYEYGVVRNPNALQAISREVLHQVVDKHRTVLIMVQRIRHLLNIEHTLRKQNPKLRIGLALGGPDAELVREIENCKKRIQAVRARKSSELTAKLEADLLKSIESMRSVKAHLIEVSKTQAQVVEALNDRKLDIAIASPAWNQGIDIPTLDVVLNAGGLKSEIITVQIGGRGMTIADGKSDYLLIDIFDASHHHLVSHFGERICIYSKRGWL